MKYLAFDIEAANGFNPASICSVGIVIADENFNLVEKQNLWINPKSKYNLDGTRPNVGINLHLDKKLLDASPDFAGRYEEIKKLLTASDTCVLGHAVDSDVRMLNAAIKKYKLPPINFDFVCSQLLYKCYKGDKDVMGLDKIAAELGVTINHHASDEDAYMSLLTLKFLCETNNLDVEGLLKKYNVRKGKNFNGEITRSVCLSGQISKKNITKVSIENIQKFIAGFKSQKSASLSLKGKKIALSRELEVAEQSVWQPIVEKILSEGGEYTPKAGKCDVYVFDKTKNRGDKMRENYIDNVIKDGKNIVKTELTEFLK